MKIRIDKDILIYENWYKGEIINEGCEYPFWLIHRKEFGEESYFDIQWFFKAVPKEIRKLKDEIIEDFKNKKL